MNFWELISRIISIIATFILFLIVLIVIKYYVYDFLTIFNFKNSCFNLFLEIKSSDQDNLILGDKILINKYISIGNEANNDIVLENRYDYLVRFVIFVHDNQIYAENLNNTDCIKIGNNNILGKVKLQGNEEIIVLNTSFKLVKE